MEEIFVLPGVYCVCIVKNGRIKKLAGEFKEEYLPFVQELSKADVEQAIVDFEKNRLLMIKMNDEHIVCIVEKSLEPERILMEMERYGISRHRHKS